MPSHRTTTRNQTSFRVRYAETDQMGIAYHANYLVWMEIGRVELCRALGLSYRSLEAEEGLLLSVVNVQCRYVHPARYDQQICVETEVTMANSRMVEFAYRIVLNDSDRLLAEGATRHIWLNRELRPSRLPAAYIAVLQPNGVQSSPP